MVESSSTSVLRRLCCLDWSSPDFHDQLSNELYGKEYQELALNLETADVKWLVEYLDKVRRRIIIPRPQPLELA